MSLCRKYPSHSTWSFPFSPKKSRLNPFWSGSMPPIRASFDYFWLMGDIDSANGTFGRGPAHGGWNSANESPLISSRGLRTFLLTRRDGKSAPVAKALKIEIFECFILFQTWNYDGIPSQFPCTPRSRRRQLHTS